MFIFAMFLQLCEEGDMGLGPGCNSRSICFFNNLPTHCIRPLVHHYREIRREWQPQAFCIVMVYQKSLEMWQMTGLSPFCCYFPSSASASSVTLYTIIHTSSPLDLNLLCKGSTQG
ncbi:hypothetical protein CHARACLAT_004222 [Characodon lateralis]|uniref:Uncharacterized protein n=1 Tax=Characodon lateralis TaxID=208331 RepID=A0ABU7DN84_9TELE|nr:hypothetical protein [Characodon lateralis]